MLKASTPLHIGSGARTGVIKHCRPFIPGSALRGAVGTAIIKAVCKLEKPLVNHESCEYFDDCVYTGLFGEEFGKASNIFFRFAYPLHLKCDSAFHPAPRTTYVCRNPQCRKEYDAFVPPDECETCQESVRTFIGYRCQSCGHLERQPAPISRVTLTAIDRAKVSAAQIVGEHGVSGTLHTLEVIHKGAKFGFEIVVDREFEHALGLVEATLTRALPDEGIGGGKSRGLGKVAVEDLRVEGVDTGTIEKRAENIDSRAFSVRLLSPMLLEGKMLEPSSLLEGARRAYSWVFHEGKPKLPEVKPEGRAVGAEMVSGWSLKTGRRRRIEPAISSGSVFQFKCDEKNEELALALAALEFHAVGAYKPHGCGQLIVEATR